MGHPIKEVRTLFARELMSPEISDDDTTIPKKSDDQHQEEIYFVLFISWCSDEVLFIKIFNLLKYK